MRIMIVTDQYPPMVGGVPNVTYGLATDLAQRGHSVSVVAPSYGSRDVRRIEQNVHVYRFSSFEWPTYRDLRIPFLPFLPFRNVIKRADPDVIHIHSPIVLGNIAQILAGGLRKPLIATNHYLPINMARSLTTEAFLGKQVSNVTYSYLVNFCNHCEYVTAPTQTALNLLYEHGLRTPARAISNGIDLQKFSPGSRDVTVLQRFGLPTDRPLLLHVNRLSEEKRVNVLLDAVPQVQTPIHVALVGTGPAEAELRAQVERLQIGSYVSFLGFLSSEDLLALRRSADLFVIPSQADLQSLATMEAMACGLPVIAADSYALPELVHHQHNGFLFSPGKSSELAHAIDQLVTNEEMRSQMGKESLKIIAKHDRIKVLEEWEGLYQRLASEFRDQKLRRQQLRKARLFPEYHPRTNIVEQFPRIRKTGDLHIDKSEKL